MTRAASIQPAQERDGDGVETSRAADGKNSDAVVAEWADELAARTASEHEIDGFDKLTPRLKQVLRMLAEGLSTKEIAAHLNVSKKTVEFHRSRLTKKLGIRAIALLTRYAVRVGAIRP